jgi:hypothetical protein
MHDINTRFNQNLQLRSANLTFVQKGVSFLEVIFTIKMLHKDIKHLKSALRT